MVEPRISGTLGMRQEYTLTGEWDASPLQSTRHILIPTDSPFTRVSTEGGRKLENLEDIHVETGSTCKTW